MRYSNTVAILGAGSEDGIWLAKSICKSYRILLMDEGLQKLTALSLIVGQHYQSALTENLLCSKEAGWEADIIVIAAPGDAQETIAEQIQEVATRKTVILLNRSASMLQKISGILPHSDLAEVLLEHAPESPVCKASLSGINQVALDTTTKLLTCCEPINLRVHQLISV